jgi:hypothetical protein
MSNTATQDSVIVAVRFPAEVADGMRKAAVANDRTVSAELRRAARLYLETQEASGFRASE